MICLFSSITAHLLVLEVQVKEPRLLTQASTLPAPGVAALRRALYVANPDGELEIRLGPEQ